jgi:Ca-activated chloride channel family protein
MTYKTVSLNGEKLTITVTNNGKLWDSQINIKTLKGTDIIGGRTYANPKAFEVDAGTYNIDIIARDVKGLQSSYTIENVSVGNGGLNEVAHDFKTGIANLGATYNGQPFDVFIKINDAATGKDVTAKRTYKETPSFILNPGKYTVIMAEHGVYNSSAKSVEFTLEIKQGETVTEIKEVK